MLLQNIGLFAVRCVVEFGLEFVCGALFMVTAQQPAMTLVDIVWAICFTKPTQIEILLAHYW